MHVVSPRSSSCCYITITALLVMIMYFRMLRNASHALTRLITDNTKGSPRSVWTQQLCGAREAFKAAALLVPRCIEPDRMSCFDALFPSEVLSSLRTTKVFYSVFSVPRIFL